MQPAIACFLLAIVSVVAGGPLFEGRIIGGIPVAPPPDPNGPLEYPYVVSIELDNKHFCAGFIYNPKWIVTTASCMENKVISRLTVVAGQVNLIDIDPTEKRESVFRVLPYETYNNVTRKDDIALIELSKSFLLDNTTIGLIKFNEVYTDESFTPAGTFMGWGATVLDGSPSSRLRYAEVTMVENDRLCIPYDPVEFTISSMICAASKPATQPPNNLPLDPTPCNSDEGAPLVQTYTPFGATEKKTIVVGVLSKYSPTCNFADSSVFTRLSIYYAWLYNTAGEQVYYLPPN